MGLTDGTTGGTWSAANTTASISSTGVVAGETAGTDTIFYTVTNSCGTATASKVIAINALPEPGIISGPSAVCLGQSIPLSETVTGSWSSASAWIASVSTSGVVTAMSLGTDTIIYTATNPCGSTTASKAIVVNPLPPPIAVSAPFVCSGFTTAVSDTLAGGLWSASPDSVATITASGIVSGAGGGAAIVTYTLPATGCYSTSAVSVTAVPPIGGASHVCAYGDTIYVTDAAAGGDWSSTLVTISSSGVVTGFATGVGAVTYTMPSGCYATKAVTVLPVPSAITSTSHICITARQQLLTGRFTGRRVEQRRVRDCYCGQRRCCSTAGGGRCHHQLHDTGNRLQQDSGGNHRPAAQCRRDHRGAAGVCG